MLDHLRDQAAASKFQDESVPVLDEFDPKPRRTRGKLFGMNAQQRFIITLLLLFVVCVMGVTLLFVTGKVVPPFLY